MVSPNSVAMAELGETNVKIQAAQATFKSIKAVVPLLDRVLVQRFKPETVSTTLNMTPTLPDLPSSLLENRLRYLPPLFLNDQPSP